MPNYKQIFARKKANEEKILKVCSNAKHEPGIYIMIREDSGFKYAYIGQAVDILSRLCSHLEGYDQHIDKSIRSHKLYSEENTTGWKIGCLYFPKELLNEKEQYYIKLYANKGYQLRNKTSGSQDGSKFGIAENKAPKTYRDGVKYGEIKTKRKVCEYFSKYLDFSIKGESNKIKSKKFNEFMEWLNEKEN